MKIFLPLIFLLFCNFIFAQNIKTSFSSIYQLDTTSVSQARHAIKMQFGETDFSISPKKEWEELAKANHISIKMYYSKFPQNIDFQTNTQKILNDKRIQNLLEQLPILSQKTIYLEMIGQENCENVAQASALFHGFLIDYEVEKPTPTQSFQPPLETKNTSNVPDLQTNNFERFDISHVNNEFAKEVRQKHIGKDSTSYLVFERNITAWDSVVIVADWTSSMYPFTLQLLIWQVQNKKNASKILGYIFFNDGDKTPDNQKKIGQTGGIYVSNSPSLAAALEKMGECKRNGNGGGDFAENNIEALLMAIQQFPQAKSFVMIADNYGKIKDLALSSQLTKPIHIILARMPAFQHLTEDYLEVALQTGGSLHLKLSDYQTTEELKDLLDAVKSLKEEKSSKKKKKQKN